MPMMDKYIHSLIIVVGAEILVFYIICFVMIQWNKKLRRHLSSEQPEFYKDKISAPYFAGDDTVLREQLRAIKNTYLATMPDKISAYYQRRLRQLAVIGLLALLSGFIIFVAAMGTFFWGRLT